jgi:hypothetical protein
VDSEACDSRLFWMASLPKNRSMRATESAASMAAFLDERWKGRPPALHAALSKLCSSIPVFRSSWQPRVVELREADGERFVVYAKTAEALEWDTAECRVVPLSSRRTEVDPQDPSVLHIVAEEGGGKTVSLKFPSKLLLQQWFAALGRIGSGKEGLHPIDEEPSQEIAPKAAASGVPTESTAPVSKAATAENPPAPGESTAPVSKAATAENPPAPGESTAPVSKAAAATPPPAGVRPVSERPSARSLGRQSLRSSSRSTSASSRRKERVPEAWAAVLAGSEEASMHSADATAEELVVHATGMLDTPVAKDLSATLDESGSHQEDRRRKPSFRTDPRPPTVLRNCFRGELTAKAVVALRRRGITGLQSRFVRFEAELHSLRSRESRAKLHKSDPATVEGDAEEGDRKQADEEFEAAALNKALKLAHEPDADAKALVVAAYIEAGEGWAFRRVEWVQEPVWLGTVEAAPRMHGESLPSENSDDAAVLASAWAAVTVDAKDRRVAIQQRRAEVQEARIAAMTPADVLDARAAPMGATADTPPLPWRTPEAETRRKRLRAAARSVAVLETPRALSASPSSSKPFRAGAAPHRQEVHGRIARSTTPPPKVPRPGTRAELSLKSKGLSVHAMSMRLVGGAMHTASWLESRGRDRASRVKQLEHELHNSQLTFSPTLVSGRERARKDGEAEELTVVNEENQDAVLGLAAARPKRAKRDVVASLLKWGKDHDKRLEAARKALEESARSEEEKRHRPAISTYAASRKMEVPVYDRLLQDAERRTAQRSAVEVVEKRILGSPPPGRKASPLVVKRSPRSAKSPPSRRPTPSKTGDDDWDSGSEAGEELERLMETATPPQAAVTERETDAAGDEPSVDETVHDDLALSRAKELVGKSARVYGGYLQRSSRGGEAGPASTDMRVYQEHMSKGLRLEAREFGEKRPDVIKKREDANRAAGGLWSRLSRESELHEKRRLERVEKEREAFRAMASRMHPTPVVASASKPSPTELAEWREKQLMTGQRVVKGGGSGGFATTMNVAARRKIRKALDHAAMAERNEEAERRGEAARVEKLRREQIEGAVARMRAANYARREAGGVTGVHTKMAWDEAAEREREADWYRKLQSSTTAKVSHSSFEKRIRSWDKAQKARQARLEQERERQRQAEEDTFVGSPTLTGTPAYIAKHKAVLPKVDIGGTKVRRTSLLATRSSFTEGGKVLRSDDGDDEWGSGEEEEEDKPTSPPKMAIPPGWKSAVDESTGRAFYFREGSEAAVQWEFPHDERICEEPSTPRLEVGSSESPKSRRSSLNAKEKHVARLATARRRDSVKQLARKEQEFPHVSVVVESEAIRAVAATPPLFDASVARIVKGRAETWERRAITLREAGRTGEKLEEPDRAAREYLTAHGVDVDAVLREINSTPPKIQASPRNRKRHASPSPPTRKRSPPKPEHVSETPPPANSFVVDDILASRAGSRPRDPPPARKPQPPRLPLESSASKYDSPVSRSAAQTVQPASLGPATAKEGGASLSEMARSLLGRRPQPQQPLASSSPVERQTAASTRLAQPKRSSPASETTPKPSPSNRSPELKPTVSPSDTDEKPSPTGQTMWLDLLSAST